MEHFELFWGILIFQISLSKKFYTIGLWYETFEVSFDNNFAICVEINFAEFVYDQKKQQDVPTTKITSKSYPNQAVGSASISFY